MPLSSMAETSSRSMPLNGPLSSLVYAGSGSGSSSAKFMRCRADSAAAVPVAGEADVHLEPDVDLDADFDGEVDAEVDLAVESGPGLDAVFDTSLEPDLPGGLAASSLAMPGLVGASGLLPSAMSCKATVSASCLISAPSSSISAATGLAAATAM